MQMGRDTAGLLKKTRREKKERGKEEKASGTRATGRRRGRAGWFEGSWKVKLEEEGSVPRYAIDDSLLLLSI